MEADFWHRRWKKNQIPFHEGVVNRLLRQWWPATGIAPGASVLVPLCGKAVDMAWIARQGHPVTGVELSEIACEDFFREQGLTPTLSEDTRYRRFETPGIRLWCGDFFALTPDDLPDLALTYDRAALIALPPDMRRRYARHLADLSPPGTRLLLLTLDYPVQGFDPPPFRVSDAEVEHLFGKTHTIQRLHHQPLPASDALAARGFRDGTESVFLLEKR